MRLKKYFPFHLNIPAISFALSAMLLGGCSAEKNTLFSKSYHNLTARDNAYFLARERMKDVEKQLFDNRKEDYNQILKISIPLDTNANKALYPKLDDILKKASLPIQKHKNSKWVDDSYLLVGRSRIYKNEVPLAIETFKYVNTKGPDINARHAALIQLMRSFIIQKDYLSAAEVDDYLNNQELNKINKSDYFVLRGHFHQTAEDYEQVHKDLEEALKLMPKKEQKARIFFINGQVNQLLGNDEESYKNYKAVLKNNPNYELSFYARLSMAQVTGLSKSSDRKRIEKYFKKLLRDQKNVDYKDRIYYEMGNFELKQNNIPKAIEYLKLSLINNTSNAYQKAYSYLRLGEIHYERLQEFELAKAYYDSTVTTLDVTDKRFKEISARQKVLEEFVKQITIIKIEDSLQKLAKMDSASLNRLVDNFILIEKEQAKKKLEQEKNSKKNSPVETNPFSPVTGDPNSKWHFYNPDAIAIGKADFLKKWGKRPLEDNWRRSRKELTIDFEGNAKADSISALGDEEEKEVEIKVDRQKFYKDIPFTKEDMKASNERVEDALFELGKIYNFKLLEPTNAISSFEKLLVRFKESEYEPEVLYYLYLIYKNKQDNKADQFKAKLLSKYPNSLYTKIIKNPNYVQESKVANQKANVAYKQAYELYEGKNYLEADSALSLIKAEFPESDIDDKLDLLKILITGQTKNALVYKASLENFIKIHATSAILPKANQLLAASNAFIDAESKKGKVVSAEGIKFSTDFNKPHYFILALPTQFSSSKEALKGLTEYNVIKNKSGQIKIEIVNYSDSLYLIAAKTFEDKSSALIYYTNFINDDNFLKTNKNLKYSVFVVTEDNYNLLMNFKRIDLYIKFFKENY